MMQMHHTTPRDEGARGAAIVCPCSYIAGAFPCGNCRDGAMLCLDCRSFARFETSFGPFCELHAAFCGRCGRRRGRDGACVICDSPHDAFTAQWKLAVGSL